MAVEPKDVRKAAKDVRRRSRVRDDGPPEPNRMDHNGPETMVGLQASASVHFSLLALCERQDGYIRIIPDGAAKSVYIKWKFSRGEWKGYYVMAVVQIHEMPYGLHVLRQKLDEVDVGVKNPVKDTAYDN